MKNLHKIALNRETLRPLDSLAFGTVPPTISHGDLLCTLYSPHCG